jgi:hypothetical protein
LSDSLISDLTRFRSWISSSEKNCRLELDRLLSRSEVEALELRLNKILEVRRFPSPGPGRHYPWPLI